MTLSNIQAAHDVRNDVSVVIEIPANSSSIKYEYDKDSDMLFVDRFMPTAMHYPCDYGFVPNTLSDDGDPVDVLVITPFPVQPGVVVRCRVLGVLIMTDESGEDAKILAVPTQKTCAQYAHIETMEDISPVLLNSIVHFFEHYKGLEKNKWVKIEGWKGVDHAVREIESSIQRYAEIQKGSEEV